MLKIIQNFDNLDFLQSRDNPKKKEKKPMKKIALFLFVTSTSFLMAGSNGGCGCHKKAEPVVEAKKECPCPGNDSRKDCPCVAENAPVNQTKSAAQPVQAVNPISQ